MAAKKIRVLVVEDSLVFRSLLVKYINEDPELEVVAEANDPYEAREAIIKFKPDVMTLDVELPRMTGLEFLRKLMPQYPIRTLVVSSLSEKVFEALQVGAVDFVAKPKVNDKKELDEFIKNELPEKIKAASRARLRTSYGRNPQTGAQSVRNAALIKSAEAVKVSENLRKRDAKNNDDESVGEKVRELSLSGSLLNKEDMIIAIGASTGGCEATTAILERLGPDLPGIVVTQHMPEGFTKMYATRLDTQAGLDVRVKEAENGDVVKPGHVYIAPGGDRHMEIIKANGVYTIRLRNFEKVNGHKPSVEVLFNSVAEVAKDKAVGVILTGMGADGAKGLLKMKESGAKTIGQDETTSVVYGMPKVAYDIGAVMFQEKLLDIPARIYGCTEQVLRRK